MGKIIFEEEKRFAQYDVLVLIGFFAAGLTYRLADYFLLGNTAWSTFSILATILLAIGLFGLLFFLIKLKLKTRVTQKNIHISYAPNLGLSRKIKLKDVQEVDEINLPLSSILSGWRVHFRGVEEYGLLGRKGILISLRDGARVFIESKYPRKMKETIERGS